MKINKKRAFFLIGTIQASALATLTFFGVAQIFQPSFALFTDQANTKLTFSTAFIFPKTVNNLVDKSHKASDSAKKHHDKILDLYKKLGESKDPKEIKNLIKQIKTEKDILDIDNGQAQKILSQLLKAQNTAKNNVFSANKNLSSHSKDGILKENVQSANHVLNYVHAGLIDTQKFANKSKNYSNSANALVLKTSKGEKLNVSKKVD